MGYKQQVDARVSSINRRASDELQYKTHSEDGVVFVTDTSAAESGYYYGFIVLAEAVVSSITHVDSSKNGDITAVTSIPAGAYISQPGGFTTLTLTSGEVMLLKYTPNK